MCALACVPHPPDMLISVFHFQIEMYVFIYNSFFSLSLLLLLLLLLLLKRWLNY